MARLAFFLAGFGTSDGWRPARTLHHPKGSPDTITDGAGGLIVSYPHGVFWTVRGDNAYHPAASVAAAKAQVAAAQRGGLAGLGDDAAFGLLTSSCVPTSAAEILERRAAAIQHELDSIAVRQQAGRSTLWDGPRRAALTRELLQLRLGKPQTAGLSAYNDDDRPWRWDKNAPAMLKAQRWLQILAAAIEADKHDREYGVYHSEAIAMGRGQEFMKKLIEARKWREYGRGRTAVQGLDGFYDKADRPAKLRADQVARALMQNPYWTRYEITQQLAVPEDQAARLERAALYGYGHDGRGFLWVRARVAEILAGRKPRMTPL